MDNLGLGILAVLYIATALYVSVLRDQARERHGEAHPEDKARYGLYLQLMHFARVSQAVAALSLAAYAMGKLLLSRDWSYLVIITLMAFSLVIIAVFLLKAFQWQRGDQLKP